MLIVVHSLIKFDQFQDVFVFNLIVVVSLCKENLFQMYCDQSFGFQGDAFKHFNGLVECVDDTISMRWIID
jgi:hypothetical protein